MNTDLINTEIEAKEQLIRDDLHRIELLKTNIAINKKLIKVLKEGKEKLDANKPNQTALDKGK